PTSERIRILRSMSGASFIDYDRAYQQVYRTRKNLIPASAATSTGVVSLRAARLEAVEEEPNELQRARHTSDLLWRFNNFKTITCDCGTKLRVPPKFKESTIKCPHCGRIHTV
ncbi:MAG: peptidase M28, partial [Syntrophobacterales bacterium CG23_combo_of_CG06-09_8_20_14_all_48_27]